MDGFLQQLSTGDQVKDWQHASKLFVGDNYRLSPKMGYLYHVVFEFGPNVDNAWPGNQGTEAGMLVKSVDLPKFTIDTKTLNSYNKPNIVQTKAKYDPVNISFHDDSADVILSLWANYYSYHYSDMDMGVQRDPANGYYQNTEYGERTDQFGYAPKNSFTLPQFFKSIRIFSLHQKKFTEYILVNPTITSFKHGSHVSGSQDPMQHDMTVAYEFVLYAKGNTSKNTVKGFADIHYDTKPSPLTPANGTRSIMGPGGIINTADDIVTDIANGRLDQAGLKALRGLNNLKGTDLKSAALGELGQFTKEFLRGNNPLNNINIPNLGDMNSRILSGPAAGVNESNKNSVFDVVSNGASALAITSGGVAGIALAAGIYGAKSLGKMIQEKPPTPPTAAVTPPGQQSSPATPPAPDNNGGGEG